MLLLCMAVLLPVTLAMMHQAVLLTELVALVVALVLGAIVEMTPVALQATLLVVALVQVVLPLVADLVMATAASLVDDTAPVVCSSSFPFHPLSCLVSFSSFFSASLFSRLLCLLDLDLCTCFERILKYLRVSKMRRQCTVLHLVVPCLHCHQNHNPAFE